jgi:hypothetical protein
MISYNRFFAEALVTGEEDSSVVVRYDSTNFVLGLAKKTRTTL